MTRGPMIERRFSAGEFAKAGVGTPQARELSKQLKNAILEELEPALAATMQSVIDPLNSLALAIRTRRTEEIL